MPGYSHILLAVDFSTNSEAVIERALAMSEAFSASISLVHVVEFVQVDLSNELVLPQEVELDQEMTALAEKRLNDIANRHGLENSERIVCHGSTRKEILHVAEERNVDLIVIGSHGRHGIQLLLGSTANAVLHGAPCDVLAVRIQD